MDTPAPINVVLGIKPWKRWQIRLFLKSWPYFAANAKQALNKQARSGGVIAVWAAREPEGFAAEVTARGVSFVRMEDGFLRSTGLGSNHVGAASLVLDAQGIYFDSRTASTLETLLQGGECGDAELLGRATSIRKRLVALNLTKYNVGTHAGATVGASPGQRRVLVVGQVENDASLRFGSPVIRTNLELLQRVRADEPDAWIAYKPHPDIEAGTRPGHLKDAEVLRYANQIVRGVSVTALFPDIDVLHTMTSLTGFEALLRGVPVVTWGQPFYASWGLTEDRYPLARRTRRLTLDELVAGALILYPLYADPVTGERCEVERVVDRLAEMGAADSRSQRSVLLRYGRLCRGWLRSMGLLR